MAPTTSSMPQPNTTSAPSTPEKPNKRKHPSDVEPELPTPQKKQRTLQKYSPTLRAWFNVYPPCLTRKSTAATAATTATALEEHNGRDEETLPVRVPLPSAEGSRQQRGRTALEESNERYEAHLAAKRKAKDLEDVRRRFQEAAERWDRKLEEKAERVRKQPNCPLCEEEFVERTPPLSSVREYTCTNEKCDKLFCLGCKAKHLKHDSRCPFCWVQIQGVEVRKPKWDWEDHYDDDSAESDTSSDAGTETSEESRDWMEASFWYFNGELRDIREMLRLSERAGLGSRGWGQYMEATRQRLEVRGAPLRDGVLAAGVASPPRPSRADGVHTTPENSGSEPEPELELQLESEESDRDDYPSGRLYEMIRQRLLQGPGEARARPMVESRPQHRYARGHRRVSDAARNLLDAVEDA